MTNLVIVVKDGRVDEVLCRNKNVEVELLDMDTQDPEELQQLEKRLNEVHGCKSYKDIM